MDKVFNFDVQTSLRKTYANAKEVFEQCKEQFSIDETATVCRKGDVMAYDVSPFLQESLLEDASIGMEGRYLTLVVKAPKDIAFQYEAFPYEEIAPKRYSRRHRRNHAILEKASIKSESDFLAQNQTKVWVAVQVWLRLLSDCYNEEVADRVCEILNCSTNSFTDVVGDACRAADAALFSQPLPLGNRFYSILAKCAGGDRLKVYKVFSFLKNVSLTDVPGMEVLNLISFCDRQERCRKKGLGFDLLVPEKVREKIGIINHLWTKCYGCDPHFSKSTTGKFYYGPGKTLPATERSANMPRNSLATKWLEVAYYFAPVQYGWEFLPSGLLLHDPKSANGEYLHKVPVPRAVKCSVVGSLVGNKTEMFVRTDYTSVYSDEVMSNNISGDVYAVQMVMEDDPSARPEVTAQVTSVPKSYKTYRIITMMKTLQAHFGFQLFNEKMLPEYTSNPLLRACIHSDDQEAQRELLRLSVHTGVPVATTDCSAASDMHSMAILKRCMPPAWYKAIADVRPAKFVINTEVVITSYCVGPMGAGCTFDVMQNIMLFAALANDYVEDRLKGDNHAYPNYSSFIDDMFSDDICSYKRFTGVVGDDVISSTRNINEFWELLDWLGFDVNQDKSFATGVEGESCGAYLIDGHVVTVPRFSRKFQSKSLGPADVPTIQNCAKIETVESLISLQHRLWDDSPSNREFIASIVDSVLLKGDKQRKPSRAEVGSTLPVCWGLVPSPSIVNQDGVAIMAPVSSDYNPLDSVYQDGTTWPLVQANAAAREGYWIISEVFKEARTKNNHTAFSDAQIGFVNTTRCFVEYLRYGASPIPELITQDEREFVEQLFGSKVVYDEKRHEVTLANGEVIDIRIATDRMLLPTNPVERKLGPKRLDSKLSEVFCESKPGWSLDIR